MTKQIQERLSSLVYMNLVKYAYSSFRLQSENKLTIKYNLQLIRILLQPYLHSVVNFTLSGIFINFIVNPKSIDDISTVVQFPI